MARKWIHTPRGWGLWSPDSGGPEMLVCDQDLNPQPGRGMEQRLVKGV